MLFFALYRDLAGVPDVEVDVPADATARDAVERLRSLSPAFGRLPANPAVAVNETYVSIDTRLSAGDEIALIPPVAGG
jgi:molybdopterin converting factor subunit 1